ncbi:PIN domain-containing protein [Bacteroides fragilis]
MAIRTYQKSRVNVIGYDYCRDVESVFEKYFKQEKPFGAKGKDKEFPDAFVLTSLEALQKTNIFGI